MLYPFALALIGMAPLTVCLWIAAGDLARHLNGGRA